MNVLVLKSINIFTRKDIIELNIEQICLHLYSQYRLLDVYSISFNLLTRVAHSKG